MPLVTIKKTTNIQQDQYQNLLSLKTNGKFPPRSELAWHKTEGVALMWHMRDVGGKVQNITCITCSSTRQNY